MQTAHVLLGIALLASPLAACARTPAPTPTPVAFSVAGSSSMAPLLTALTERFHVQHPSIAVTVEAANSARGWAQAAGGAAALGALSIPPPGGAWTAPIALDGIAIVVHPDNPIASLTMRQLYDVFSGRAWHWSELRAAVAVDEIRVVSREPGSGTRAVFEGAVMAGGRVPTEACAPSLPDLATTAPGCETDPVTTTAVVMYGSEAVVEYVAAHPGAIGYLSYGYLAALPEGQVVAVRVEDVPPTPEHVADGRYRLARPFTLVAPREPTGGPRLFVDFCLGPEGQAIVGEHHVPVRAGE